MKDKSRNDNDLVQSLILENAALRAYRAYCRDLYGQGYGVTNYHLNGDTEPLDNFLDEAEAAYDLITNQKKEESANE